MLGWEIDHITPFDKGGTDEHSNLHALQWKNNATKHEGRLTCPVTATSNTNIGRPKKLKGRTKGRDSGSDRSETTEAKERVGNPRWEIYIPAFRLDRWLALARKGKNLALELSFRGEAIPQAVIREVWERINRSVPDKPMPDVTAFLLNEKDFNDLFPKIVTVDFDFYSGHARAHIEECGTPVSLRDDQNLAFVVSGISIDRSIPDKFVILINEKHFWSLEETLEHELDHVYDKISWSESSPFVEKLREAVDRLKAGKPLRLMSSASVTAIATGTQRSIEAIPGLSGTP